MFSRATSPPPEFTDKPNQPPLSIPSKSRKRLYALGGIIAIIVIASALFIPQILGSPIDLGLNYTVGEKNDVSDHKHGYQPNE